MGDATHTWEHRDRKHSLQQPYLCRANRSSADGASIHKQHDKIELMALMVGGFATIAGGVLVAYVGMGIDAGHLVAASVISAPAALLISKLMIPETEQSVTLGHVELSVDEKHANVVDAATNGH